ncbi:hypothetical protein JCM10295v2_002967 [Rhodotorula toruloides]
MLQHMLKYPRTSKRFEMLYMKRKLYEDVEDKFEPEERYKEVIEQNSSDLGRLFSSCDNLRELHTFSGQGFLLDTPFPFDELIFYNVLRAIKPATLGLVELLNQMMRGEGTADEIAAQAFVAMGEETAEDIEDDEPSRNAGLTADESSEISDGEATPDAPSTSNSLEVQPDQDSTLGRPRAVIQNLRSLRLAGRITRHGSTVTCRSPKTGEAPLHGRKIEVAPLFFQPQTEVWKEQSAE